MLDSADILINGKPAIYQFTIKWQICVVGIAIAKEIPAGTHKSVHGVRFPPSRFAAAGAIHLPPALQLGQGRTSLRGQTGSFGQLDRQLLGWNGHGATGLAMDHRNWTAPVALS